MTKEERIMEAINAFNAGVPVNEILKRFKCSKSWLYKWISRYKSTLEGTWYKEHSRKPKRIVSAISATQREEVIKIRKSLLDQPYSQRGAVSIQYEMRDKGMEVLPVWKINRILNKSSLIEKPQRELYRSNEYPQIGVITDQMDFVGPRYIKGDGRFYSLNIIDTTTHFVHVNPLRSRATEEVLRAVVRFWQQRGMPDFLQMDNELSFRGSNRHPHSFGMLIRFALHQGIRVIFIPVREPWRNGIIEKFNDTYHKRFISKKTFASFEDLQRQSVEFENFHNKYHRYSAHKNKTPLEQIKEEMQRDQLAASFEFPKKPYPLKQGKVILARFIRSNLVLDVFGEKFMMPKHLAYSYVTAEIDVEQNMLCVMRDGRKEWQRCYAIPV